mgnify:CR=1 FL=1
MCWPIDNGPTHHTSPHQLLYLYAHLLSDALQAA